MRLHCVTSSYPPTPSTDFALILLALKSSIYSPPSYSSSNTSSNSNSSSNSSNNSHSSNSSSNSSNSSSNSSSRGSNSSNNSNSSRGSNLFSINYYNNSFKLIKLIHLNGDHQRRTNHKNFFFLALNPISYGRLLVR